VTFLELRHLEPIHDSRLVTGKGQKVQMRLSLGPHADHNWQRLKSEVRTQIRKANKLGLSVSWGNDDEFIGQFYKVFSQNMRDLGTPVFPANLFAKLARAFGPNAEFGIVHLDTFPIAACFAIHGDGLTEIPSAASLHAYRKTAANSLMYWNAIERAIARGQNVFDFGRSTLGSATYDFKKKWGAIPRPVTWQYYLRRGDTQAMRPDNRKFALATRLWKQLPVAVTRVLGPMIVRGIP
jgi:FemAB-related protein (PEP-CTERM system-associated)